MKHLALFCLSILALVTTVWIVATQGLAAGMLFATAAAIALKQFDDQRTRCHLYALGPWTLMDLANRTGRHVTSLMEGVLTYAPEMRTIPAFPRNGLDYSTLIRTELPSGDFAKVGSGIATQKSVWDKQVGSMSKFEANIRVAEDIVIATMAQTEDLQIPDILADEAVAFMRGSAIRLGSQFWYGTKISTDGFAGLSTQVDTGNNEVDAGGSGAADSSSVYLVMIDDNSVNPQGIHFVVGNGGRMKFSDTWLKQQVNDPNDATKLMMAYCNNFLSYLGLVMPRTQALYRVKNVTLTANQGFTDAVASALWRKVPLALRADKSKWRWFMNANPLYTLQASRATVTVATPGNKGVSSGGVFPDVPDSCLGIPIVPTDSLLTTERAGLHQ